MSKALLFVLLSPASWSVRGVRGFNAWSDHSPSSFGVASPSSSSSRLYASSSSDRKGEKFDDDMKNKQQSSKARSRVDLTGQFATGEGLKVGLMMSDDRILSGIRTVILRIVIPLSKSSSLLLTLKILSRFLPLFFSHLRH